MELPSRSVRCVPEYLSLEARIDYRGTVHGSPLFKKIESSLPKNLLDGWLQAGNCKRKLFLMGTRSGWYIERPQSFQGQFVSSGRIECRPRQAPLMLGKTMGDCIRAVQLATGPTLTV